MKLWLTLKHHFYTGGKLFELFYIKHDFAKYFAECPNLFKYLVSHIMMISRNNTFLYSILQDKANFLVLHNFKKCFSDTRVYQLENKYWNDYLIFSICYFWLHKKWCLQNFCLIKKWCWNSLIRMFLKSWFVKYAFSAKIWFLKTSTTIAKYKSRAIKLNPGLTSWN